MNRDFSNGYLTEGVGSQTSITATRESQASQSVSQPLAFDSQYSSLFARPASQPHQCSQFSVTSSQTYSDRPASQPPLMLGANYSVIEATPDKCNAFARPRNPLSYLPKSSAHIRSILQPNKNGSLVFSDGRSPRNTANNDLLFGGMSHAELISNLLKSRDGSLNEQITNISNAMLEFRDSLPAINNSIIAKNCESFAKLEELVQNASEKYLTASQSSFNELKAMLGDVTSSIVEIKCNESAIESRLEKCIEEAKSYIDSKVTALKRELQTELSAQNEKLVEIVRSETKDKVDGLFQLIVKELDAMTVATAKVTAIQSSEVSEELRSASAKVEQMSKSMEQFRRQNEKQDRAISVSTGIQRANYTLLPFGAMMNCSCRTVHRRQQRQCECNSFAIDKSEYCVVNNGVMLERCHTDMPLVGYDQEPQSLCRCFSVFDSDEEMESTDNSQVSDDWF